MTQAKAEDIVKEMQEAGQLRMEEAQTTVQELIDAGRKNTEELVRTVQREVAKQLENLGIDLERSRGPSRGARQPGRVCVRAVLGDRHGDRGEKPAAAGAAREDRRQKSSDEVDRRRSRAAKKSTAKKSTAKKSTAKKATAKKAPAKKSAAKKAPAKKAARQNGPQSTRRAAPGTRRSRRSNRRPAADGPVARDPRRRLDVELVRRGLAPSRAVAHGGDRRAPRHRRWRDGGQAVPASWRPASRSRCWGRRPGSWAAAARSSTRP